jgi:RNase P/RNase MRP subunit POP5
MKAISVRFRAVKTSDPEHVMHGSPIISAKGSRDAIRKIKNWAKTNGFTNVTIKSANEIPGAKGTPVSLLRRNPRKRKSAFRVAYENAAQRERLGKWLATSGSSGHGLRIAKRAAREKEGYRRARQKGIISTVRKNPSFVSYDSRAASKKYLVEALVRTAGTNRFSYGFWTGSSFAKSRGSAEKFASQSSALAAAKRILPLLPSKILSLRAVPA